MVSGGGGWLWEEREVNESEGGNERDGEIEREP